MEKASSDRLVRFITVYGTDPVTSLLDLRQIPEIDWGHYVGGELPLLGYDFETTIFPNIVSTQRPKCSTVGGEVVLEVPAREVAW